MKPFLFTFLFFFISAAYCEDEDVISCNSVDDSSDDIRIVLHPNNLNKSEVEESQKIFEKNLNKAANKPGTRLTLYSTKKNTLQPTYSACFTGCKELSRLDELLSSCDENRKKIERSRLKKDSRVQFLYLMKKAESSNVTNFINNLNKLNKKLPNTKKNKLIVLSSLSPVKKESKLIYDKLFFQWYMSGQNSVSSFPNAIYPVKRKTALFNSFWKDVNLSKKINLKNLK